MMINIQQIENEINELSKLLQKKKNELADAKESNFKEQYGDDFGCETCAYGCCVDLGDNHTYCTKSKCIYCNDYCDEYTPDNELSAYIRTNHYYDEDTVRNLNHLFGVSDIMHHTELHQKALEILTIRDKKEN